MGIKCKMVGWRDREVEVERAEEGEEEIGSGREGERDQARAFEGRPGPRRR
jgi:hypothetical protein